MKTVTRNAGVKGIQINGIPSEIVTNQNRIKVDPNNRVRTLSNDCAIGNITWMKTEDYPNGHPIVAQTAIQPLEPFLTR